MKCLWLWELQLSVCRISQKTALLVMSLCQCFLVFTVFKGGVIDPLGTCLTHVGSSIWNSTRQTDAHFVALAKKGNQLMNVTDSSTLTGRDSKQCTHNRLPWTRYKMGFIECYGQYEICFRNLSNCSLAVSIRSPSLNWELSFLVFLLTRKNLQGKWSAL